MLHFPPIHSCLKQLSVLQGIELQRFIMKIQVIYATWVSHKSPGGWLFIEGSVDRKFIGRWNSSGVWTGASKMKEKGIFCPEMFKCDKAAWQTEGLNVCKMFYSLLSDSLQCSPAFSHTQVFHCSPQHSCPSGYWIRIFCWKEYRWKNIIRYFVVAVWRLKADHSHIL